MLRRPVLAAVAALALASACSAESSPPEDTSHAHLTLPAGDGTTSSYVGYSLVRLSLPRRAGEPGTYSFGIEAFDGTPTTEFLEEQTKRMHVYVVREDLSVFRHVHPTMASNGTWSGRVTLPEGGRYRLVAEFTADDHGGLGDSVILGAWAHVGPPETLVQPATETALEAQIEITAGGELRVGPSEPSAPSLSIGVSARGEPAQLGTFLGTYAHVTGFNLKTGAVVHTHPLGAPVVEGDQTMLEFYTEFREPGHYELFVQVRVSGVLRTVPVTVHVA
ncbi:MAG TPA: hypothetical protein VLI04_07815 [Nocardioidaceae bacterium]|nr:hypothetical protein [Nocardioidaceae bacterium]